MPDIIDRESLEPNSPRKASFYLNPGLLESQENEITKQYFYNISPSILKGLHTIMHNGSSSY